MKGAPADEEQARLSCPRPFLSVIIPAYGGAATILACLASLQRALQGWPPDRRELIVVESSGDGAAEKIRAEYGWVRLIESEQRLSAGQARNVGIGQARGEWLFFVDQDCVVPGDWISALLVHLGQPGVGGAGGSLAVANGGNLSGWCTYFLEFLYHFPRLGKAVSSQGFLLGSNSAWRAEILKSLAFPDQTLAEDVLLSHAVRRHGWTLIYDPSITVWHQNREGWPAFFAYCRAMGRASARAHQLMRPWWLPCLALCPLLLYGVPFGVLAMITWRLWRAPRGYLLRFLLLLPMCLLGQWLWAHAFAVELGKPCPQ
jgi:GT2 family glycosyltransferase